jgi:DNA-directed RNA polymerase subunit alpha
MSQDDVDMIAPSAILEDSEDSPVEPRAALPRFDLQNAESLSFASLEEGKVSVYSSDERLHSFRRSVEGLPTGGEDGRRRGLGLWVLADYPRCEKELAAHEKDDTAAFTRAKALFALRRFGEAAALFRRLSQAYPNEPRPRAGWLEARLEEGLAKGGDERKLADELDKEVHSAPAGFESSGEGLYMLARTAELRRDWETALDRFAQGREIEPTHRALLARFAHLAERSGLDELALQAYESLLRLPPADRRVLLNLGVLYEDLGRDVDAASCYDTILRHDATDQRARLYLEDANAAMSMYYDEDLEKKEDRLNQILRIPITDFELSVRARNCLNKMDIQTLGDLVQKTEQELLSYKNFGETSLQEIKEILHSKGLRLGMPREEAVASIEAHSRRESTGDKSDVLNKPIHELALSIRARRTVETLGCLTLGDITKHSAEELLGMPNFGQTSLQELRSKLTEFGLKLKGD